jgi:hypothetical protein
MRQTQDYEKETQMAKKTEGKRRDELASKDFMQLVKIVERHEKKSPFTSWTDWHKQTRRSVIAQIIRYEYGAK